MLYNDCMLLTRLILMALLISPVRQANGIVVRGEGPADGELEFVRELQARQFYDLAEQYCIRGSEICRTSDGRAIWQMLLADCRERHAWNLREPGRSQMLSYATESITQFIRKESPAAEADLLLRVRQIELLATIVRIDTTCREFGPMAGPQALATQASSEGLQLAESLLGQIELIRKKIDSSIAREARDRARYVVAELLLLQARQTTNDRALHDKATTAAEQLMKSSGDDEMRLRARNLVAQCSLDAQDFKTFDLLIVSLNSMADNEVQQTMVAALKLRGLLRRGQPSEALQLSVDLEKRSIRSEELHTLRLAALLNLHELLYKLEASDLRQKTADEFHSLHRRLIQDNKGVWLDCCERIAVRFSHVAQFGPEAATAIESVTDLMATGDLAAARIVLLNMRPSFERNDPKVAASLSMQAGDLAIRLNDWTSADADLSSAIKLFRITNNREQEAASDLLRIYAMGRQWADENSGGRDDGNTLEAAYNAAIEQHIADYSDQKTSAKAHEWHAILLRATDPVAAANELLVLSDGASDRQLILLLQAGEILIEAAFRWADEGGFPHRELLTPAIEDWTRHLETLLTKRAAEATTNDSDRRCYSLLDFQRLMFSLRRRWSIEDDWKKLVTETNRHLSVFAASNTPDAADETLAGLSSELHDQIVVARAHANGILALGTLRQLLGMEAIEGPREVLLRQSAEGKRQVAGFLLHQAGDTGAPIPGDPQLGFLAIDLLQGQHSMPVPTDRVLSHLPLLLRASEVADDFQQFDLMIQDLTARPLTEQQLQTIAAILERRSRIKAHAGNATEVVKQFWRKLLEKSGSGTDSWFEASLQLATIAAQDHKVTEAEKVLNVITALHPDWGTPERQARAAALKLSLESAK